jgi:uncharacterized protein (DUF2336 family)
MSKEASSSDYLYRLARSGKAEDKETLAKSITTLLQSDLSKGELFLIQDILLRMLREAESDLRQSLAMHLAGEEKCPQALIDFLVYECPIDDSAPLLSHASYLTDDFLIDTGNRFESSPYWQAIALRSKVSARLSLYLVNTNDKAVQMILMTNPGANLCPVSMKILTDIAIKVTDFQGPLLQRAELTKDLAAKIYHYASKTLQDEIQYRFNINQKELEQAMHYVVAKTISTRGSVRTVSMEMMGLVRKMSHISTTQIITALEKGERAFFVCLCGGLLKADPEDILYHLEHDLIPSMAIVCRAINVTRIQFNHMLVTWRRQDNPNQITYANELTRAMTLFDGTTPIKAREVVQSWSTQ